MLGYSISRCHRPCRTNGLLTLASAVGVVVYSTMVGLGESESQTFPLFGAPALADRCFPALQWPPSTRYREVSFTTLLDLCTPTLTWPCPFRAQLELRR